MADDIPTVAPPSPEPPSPEAAATAAERVSAAAKSAMAARLAADAEFVPAPNAVDEGEGEGAAAPDGPPAPEPEPEPKAPASVTEAYAHIAEQEKTIRQLRSQLKTGGLDELREKPLAEKLDALGVDTDELFDHILQASSAPQDPQDEGDGEPSAPPSALQKTVADLQKQVEQMSQEITSHRLTQAEQKEKSAMLAMVEGDGERWPYLAAFGNEAMPLAMETARELYKINNEPPTYQEVLDGVEQALDQQAAQQYERLSRVEKFRALMSNSNGSAGKQPLKAPAASPSPTLTGAPSETPEPRPITSNDRLKRAEAVARQFIEETNAAKV